MDVDKKPLTSITYGNNSRTGESGAYNPKEVKKILSQKLNAVSKDLQELTVSATAAIRDGEDSKGYTEKANKASEEKKYLESQAVLYTKNPEIYSQLYAVQDSVKNGDEGHVASPIQESKNGEMFLKIDMQMEGSPIGFALRDGKVTFGDNEVSAEQMKEVMNFLYMRGISNFDLPKGADSKIADSFEQAQAAIASERVEDDISRPSGLLSAGNDNDIPLDENEHLSPAEKWDREQAAAIASGKGNLAGSSVEVGDSNLNEQQPQQQASEPETKETGFKKAEKELSEWLEKGMKKKSEYTYFKRAGSVMLGNGGWTVFSSYENGNEDNVKMDGKRDKKGNVNSTYEYRIYVRPDKSGKGIDVGYAMPKGKKVSEDVADQVLDLYKSQGVTHVNLSKMSYADAAEFRNACGRKLVVPTGTGLDERKVSKIIECAKNRGSEEEILKFKYKLAVQMEKNFAKKYPGKTFKEVNKSDAEYAEDLKAEYQNTPFRHHFNNTLGGILEEKCGSLDATADQVMGANIALGKVFDIYKQQPQWSDILDPEKSPLSPEALANLNISIGQLNASEKAKFNNDASMRDFSDKQMAMIYKAIIPEETKNAQGVLSSAYAENDLQDSSQRETPNEIIRRLVDDSKSSVENISVDLEKSNVKRLTVKRFRMPKYQFTQSGDSNNNRNQNGAGKPNSNGR